MISHIDMTIFHLCNYPYKTLDQYITSLARQTKIGFHGSAGRAKFRVKESAPQKVCSDILLDENNLGTFQCRKLQSKVPDVSGIWNIVFNFGHSKKISYTEQSIWLLLTGSEKASEKETKGSPSLVHNKEYICWKENMLSLRDYNNTLKWNNTLK